MPDPDSPDPKLCQALKNAGMNLGDAIAHYLKILVLFFLSHSCQLEVNSFPFENKHFCSGCVREDGAS